MEQLTNKEIITALETGAMPDPKERFNPAPSGRPEFGQVYLIPARVRDEIIRALGPKKPVKRTPGGLPLTDESIPKVKGRQPE